VKQGLQAALEAFLFDGRVWIDLAVVTAVETDPDFGFLVDLVCRPDGSFCQARIWNLATGPTGSAAFPVEVGEEVLVVYPDAKPSSAIAIAGLPSGPAGLPAGFDNTKPILDFVNGIELRQSVTVRSTKDAPTKNVLAGVELMGDLKSAIDDVLTAFAAVTAVPTPLTGALFGAAVAPAVVTLTALSVKLAAATVTGDALPPYASTKLEAEV